MTDKKSKWVKVDDETSVLFINTGSVLCKHTKKGDVLCYLPGIVLGDRKGVPTFKAI